MYPDPEAGPPCAACGGRSLRPHLAVAARATHALIPTIDAYGSALDDIVRCERCGHMQLARAPHHHDLLALYEAAESQDYVEEEAGQRATARSALARLERYGRRGPLLEVGCWVGFLLDEARRRGWEPHGVEPSAFAAAFASERLGLEVQRADLLDAELPAHGFEAVVMADVIEHLVDPGAALDRLAATLRPGGLLYLALPDAGSRVARALGRRWWSVIPTHVQYFTRPSLETLLRRHGYEPLWLGTAPKTFSAAYYMRRVRGYSVPLSRALVSGARAGRLAELQWTPDFRDRMAVVARIASDAS